MRLIYNPALLAWLGALVPLTGCFRCQYPGGYPNCQDPDCYIRCPEVDCADGKDNDFDGDTDCDDADCKSSPDCYNVAISLATVVLVNESPCQATFSVEGPNGRSVGIVVQPGGSSDCFEARLADHGSVTVKVDARCPPQRKGKARVSRGGHVSVEETFELTGASEYTVHFTDRPTPTLTAAPGIDISCEP